MPDDFDPSRAVPVDDEFDPSRAVPASGAIRRIVGDSATSLAKGAVGSGQTLYQLADAATGGRLDEASTKFTGAIGNLATDLGDKLTGNRVGAGSVAELFGDKGAAVTPRADMGGQRFSKNLNETSQEIDDLYSPEQKAASAKVQKAEGFLPTVGAALSNPSTIIQGAIESLPVSLGMMGAVRGVAEAAGARALKAAATKGLSSAEQLAARDAAITKFSTGAPGIGVQMATDFGVSGAGSGAQAKDVILGMDEKEIAQSPVYQQLRKTMTDEAARNKIANDAQLRGFVSAGVLSAMTSPITSKLEGRAAVAGLQRTAATRAARSYLGIKDLAKAVGAEGLQETLQSGGEQIGQNVGMRSVDANYDLSTDVGRQAAMGGLSGALMGGVFHGIGEFGEHVANKRPIVTAGGTVLNPAAGPISAAAAAAVQGGLEPALALPSPQHEFPGGPMITDAEGNTRRATYADMTMQRQQEVQDAQSAATSRTMTDTHIQQATDAGLKYTLEHAQAIADHFSDKPDRHLTVLPSKGGGYTVLPTSMVSPQHIEQHADLQPGPRGLPSPDAPLAGAAMVAGADGSVRAGTRRDEQEGLAGMQAARAARQADTDLGITPRDRARMGGPADTATPDASTPNLAVMTQDEYADHLRRNGLPQGVDAYDSLTASPDLRGMTSQQRVDHFNQNREAVDGFRGRVGSLWQTVRSEASAGVKAIGASSGWTNFEVGSDQHVKGDDRHKSYAAVRDFVNTSEADLHGFLKAMRSAGFNGQVKFPGTGSRALLGFDNIVMHGSTAADAALGTTVARQFFGSRITGTQSGRDSQGRSHTQVLADAVAADLKAGRQPSSVSTTPQGARNEEGSTRQRQADAGGVSTDGQRSGRAATADAADEGGAGVVAAEDGQPTQEQGAAVRQAEGVAPSVAGSPAAPKPYGVQQPRGARLKAAAVRATARAAAKVATRAGRQTAVDGAVADRFVTRAADAATAQGFVNRAAHQAATSPQNALAEPTPAQQQAGNYQKGHVRLHGLDISIENPAGSTRTSKPGAAQTWSRTMAHHYGYIKGTVGRDGDHVDSFIGPNPASTRVFVVDQSNPSNGRFDEHKVMLGFDTADAARAAYLGAHEKGWKGLQSLTETSVEGFKKWLGKGDTTAPFVDPAIDLVPVESSNIGAVGYDADAQTLAVQFAGSGKIYHYAGVPASLHAALMGAKSVGSFFSTNIRPVYKGIAMDAARAAGVDEAIPRPTQDKPARKAKPTTAEEPAAPPVAAAPPAAAPAAAPVAAVESAGDLKTKHAFTDQFSSAEIYKMVLALGEKGTIMSRATNEAVLWARPIADLERVAPKATAAHVARAQAAQVKRITGEASVTAPAPTPALAPAPVEAPAPVAAKKVLPKKAKKNLPTHPSAVITAIARAGGITSALRSEIMGDKKKNVFIPRLGMLFQKNGMTQDRLIEHLHEEGFLSQEDIDSDLDNGGFNKALRIIEDELREPGSSQDIADADTGQAHVDREYRNYVDDIEDRAKRAGIAVAGASLDDLVTQLAEHDVVVEFNQAELDEAGYDRMTDAQRESLELSMVAEQADGVSDDDFFHYLGLSDEDIDALPTPEDRRRESEELEAIARGSQDRGSGGQETSSDSFLQGESQSEGEQRLTAEAERTRSATAEAKKRADAPDSRDFALTGSDRGTDRAAAAGQQDLLAAPAASEAAPTTPAESKALYDAAMKALGPEPKPPATFAEFIAWNKAQDQARVKAIGPVEDIAIAKSATGDRWQMVLRDASGEGPWRTQSFDRDGFSGHAIFKSKEEAIESMVRSGYYGRDDTILDKLHGTVQFQRGLYAATLIPQFSNGTMTHAQMNAALDAWNAKNDPDYVQPAAAAPAVDPDPQDRNGLRAEDRRLMKLDSAAAELAMLLKNDVSEDDFDPAEVMPGLRLWAEEAKVPADDLRAAVLKLLRASDLKKSKIATLVKALDPVAAAKAAEKADQAITDVGEKMGGARKDTAVAGGTRVKKEATPEIPGWRKRFAVTQIVASSRAGETGRWSIDDTRSTSRYGSRKGPTFATQAEAEAAVPLVAVSLKHRVAPVTVNGESRYEIVRDVTDRKRLKVVDQVFATREDAMLYLAQNAEAILETKTSFGEEILPKPETVTRKGVERRTADAKADDFLKDFGLRGVEFGNWNNQEERQEVMNHAYDALADLADLMGIPVKAIGLGGDLGLAFGARGQGLSGARAHYETDYGVINLTKMSGAGSLAHEWFHALDHYFARQDTKAPGERVKNKAGHLAYPAVPVEKAMVSHGFSYRNSGVREELRTAYDALIQTMFKKAEQYVEDTQKAEKFVGTSKTDVSNALQALRNDLAEQKNPEYWKTKNKPATAAQLEQFDTIAERLIAGEMGPLELRRDESKPNAARRWTSDALEQLSAINKAVRGRSGFLSGQSSGVLDNLRGNLTRYEARLKMLADAQAAESKTKMVPTSFAMEAKSIDQGRASDYWTTPHEMAARAFQAYVEDKAAAAGAHNDFLSYGTNSLVPTPWGWKRPYPTGTERVAINQAFDQFVGKLAVKQVGDDDVLADVEAPTRVTDTPAFKAWFGQSKVVDDAGQPQVMYHGTHADFGDFKGNDALAGAVYVTSDPKYAGNFATAQGANLRPVYVKALKIWPKTVHAGSEHKVGLLARSKGYDAMRVRDAAGDTINLAVFDPANVKSAFDTHQPLAPTDTPAFKRWFGDSKVVDASGAPRVVYHGSTRDFDSFSVERASSQTGNPNAQLGFFFSDNPAEASRYAKDWGSTGGNVAPVYLAIRQPYAMPYKEFDDLAMAPFRDLVDMQVKGQPTPEQRARIVAGQQRARDEALARRAALIAEGYDGIVVKIGGNREYIAFYPEQIKSALGNRGTFDANDPSILHDQDTPIFRSALAEAVQTKGPFGKDGTVGVGQLSMWLAARAKDGTVKNDEIVATGLDDWLKMQTGKVSKAQVGEFLDNHGVKVTETMLHEQGAINIPTRLERVMEEEGLTEYDIPEDADGWMKLADHFEEQAAEAHEDGDHDWADKRLDAMRDAMRMATRPARPSAARSKFDDYVLPGAKEGSYRELLLTTPLPDVARMSRDQLLAHLPEDMRQEIIEFNEPDEYLRDLLAEGLAQSPGGGGFVSSHFDQPNILAHVRFNERTDPDSKRVLFIEEIQSDWAQEGKKKGFDQAPMKGEVRVQEGNDATAADQWESDDGPGKKTWAVYWADGTFSGGYDSREDAEHRLATAARSKAGAVPSGPFVGKTEAWVSLAMKRMIRYAAENGYDRVAFVNGQQSADRYSLAQKVDQIRYAKRGDRYDVWASNEHGAALNDTVDKQSLKPEQIEEFVGKEVAQKIIAGAGRNEDGDMVLEGLDLQVGGEGMKAFYDRIIPNVANDVLKKLGGGRVGEVQVERPSTYEENDQMRRASDAERANPPKRYAPQPGFDVTPALRERVMAGVPLFDLNRSPNERASNPLDQALLDEANQDTTAKSLLERIAAESGSLYNRALASALLAAGVNSRVVTGFDAAQNVLAGESQAASYRPATDTVSLLSTRNVEKHLLHELVHAATVAAIRRGGLAAVELQSLMDTVRASGKVDPVLYGMRNAEEFIAEAMSNPRFQEALRGVPVERGAFKTAWDSFVNLVRKVLHLNGTTALDEALRIGADLMAETSGLKRDANFGFHDGNEVFANVSGGRDPNTPVQVTQLTGDEIRPGDDLTWSKARAWAVAEYLSEGANNRFVNDETSQTITIGSKGIRKATEGSRRGNLVQLRALAVLPELIKHAVLNNPTAAADRLGRKEIGGVQTFVAPLEIGGKVHRVVMTVRQTSSTDSYYGHHVELIDLQEGSPASPAVLDPGSYRAKGDTGEQANVVTLRELLKDVKDGPDVRGDVLADITMDGISQSVVDAFQTQRTFNWWHRTVGTQYHKAQVSPLFKRVFDAGQQFLQDVSQFAMNAADLAPNLLPKMGKLGDVFRPGVSRANMAAVSKAVFQGMLTDKQVYSDAELRGQFGLNDKQVGLYQEFRAATDRMLDELLASEASRLARGHVDAAALKAAKAEPGRAIEILSDALTLAGQPKLVAQLAAQEAASTRLKQEGFAPLQRFGNFTVHVLGPNGEQHYYGLYETESQSNRAAREMQAVFPDAVVTRGELSGEAQATLRGVSLDTMEIYAETIGASLQGNQADLFKKFLNMTANNRSALARVITRDVEGFSRDMPRVLATFVTSSARMASKNYNVRAMNEAVEAIPQDQGDLRSDADKLVSYMQNPGEENAKMRGWLFAHFIGGSIASALTNMTQPIMQTLPYLSQWGPAQAAAELAKATAMTATGAKGDAVIEKAMAEATKVGLLAPHELAHLHAESSRSFGSSGLMQRGMKAWGAFFALAEGFNRKATFIAAYRIGLTLTPEQFAKAGVADAMAFAEKAIHETQGIYNRGNRPNWARGAVGATLFTFKQFSVSYLEFVKRLPPREKAIAFAILVLAAGTQGLPFAEDLEDLIDTIGQSLGYDTNSKRALREGAIKALGQGWGSYVVDGVSSIPGVPINVQGRLGLQNLIPGTALLKKSDPDKLKEAFEVIGPVGAFVNSLTQGFGRLQDGDWRGIAVGSLPIAFQNAFKAADMLQTGAYRDTKGRVVTKTTVGDAIAKGIGFQPQAVAEKSARVNDFYQDLQLNRVVRAAIAERWARGAFENNPAKVADALKAMRDWNQHNPTSPIIIRPADIQQKLVQMAMSSDQRAIKNAPKGMRPFIAQAMQ